MPIPDLDENGLLPFGIYDCTVEEMRILFGRVRVNSNRHELFAALHQYLQEVQASGLAKFVIIDGSFITDKDNPGDVDLITVLPHDHDITANLKPFQYNLLSHKRVQKLYKLDLKAAREDSAEYEEYIYLYQQVRGRPDLRKGCLKIAL